MFIENVISRNYKIFDQHFSHGVIMKLHFLSRTKVLNGMYEANYIFLLYISFDIKSNYTGYRRIKPILPLLMQLHLFIKDFFVPERIQRQLAGLNIIVHIPGGRARIIFSSETRGEESIRLK